MEVMKQFEHHFTEKAQNNKEGPDDYKKYSQNKEWPPVGHQAEAIGIFHIYQVDSYAETQKTEEKAETAEYLKRATQIFVEEIQPDKIKNNRKCSGYVVM